MSFKYEESAVGTEASELLVEIDGDAWDRYAVTEQDRGWFDDIDEDAPYDKYAYDKQCAHEQKIARMIANIPLAYDLLRRLVTTRDSHAYSTTLTTYDALAEEARGVLKALGEDAT